MVARVFDQNYRIASISTIGFENALQISLPSATATICLFSDQGVAFSARHPSHQAKHVIALRRPRNHTRTPTLVQSRLDHRRILADLHTGGSQDEESDLLIDENDNYYMLCGGV